MTELISKNYEEIVQDILIDFAKELGVDNISSASDIAIKAKIYATQIEGIYFNQAFILKQSNPVTATNEYLDMWGDGLNVGQRKGSTNAIGKIIVGRKTASDKDISIKKGTMFSTDPDIFGKLITGITTEDTILKAGKLEVSISAKTLEVGEIANVPPRGFTVLNNPPTGIEFVRNDEGFKDGTEKEDDETYRSRFKKEKFYGTEDAFAKRAREIEGVTFAKTLANNRGPGTTDVLISSANGIPSDDLVQKVLMYLLEKRPLCCDLGVIKPKSYILNITVKIILEEGFTLESKIEEITVREKIKQAIRIYLKTVGIGGTIRKIGIADAIYNLDEIVDVIILEPTENIKLSENAIAQEGDFNVTV